MQVDGLKSTRPIEFPVEKPEEAAGIPTVPGSLEEALRALTREGAP